MIKTSELADLLVKERVAAIIAAGSGEVGGDLENFIAGWLASSVAQYLANNDILVASYDGSFYEKWGV